jgi:O-acetylserine/cysteine efflux transporter
MNFRDILLAIFVAFAWGGYATIGKAALESFPPLLFGGLRFFLVFLITSPFIFKAKIPKLQIIILSIILFLNLFILHHAITSSDTLIPLILINELAVPFSTLLGVFFLKEKIYFKDYIGIIIALIGASFIAMDCFSNFKIISANSLIIIASFTYACYNLIVKKMSHYNILSLLSQLSLLTAIYFFAFSFFQEDLPAYKEITSLSIFALIYSVVICSVMGFYIWFYLLNKYPLGKVIPFTLLSPIFGCMLTILIFNEKIDLKIIPSAILIIIGITIIELKNDRKNLSV